jgi:protein-disulfide isomerase
MTRSAFRRLVFALAVAPLALGLAACGKSSEGGGTTSGDAIAKIAPPAGKTWSDVVAKTPEGGYVMGNPAAPIKLVEFGSLTCSHCAEFAEKSFAELRDNFVASGRVSFEMRNFVRDGIDVAVSQLTRCGTPESYFALTEQAFANQTAMIERVQAAGEPAFKAAMAQPDAKRGLAIAELAGLTEFFAARGIAREQAAACLADSSAAQALAQGTQTAAEKYKIEGTPTFLFNGEKADMNAWPEVKARLETMGAR